MATRSNGANSTGRSLMRAEVALVEPGAGLLGEDAGDAFAVQIGPLVGRAVHADGQVLQALGVHLLHRVLHDGLGVFELDRRQAALQIAAVVPLVAGLGDGAQEGVDGVAGVGGVLLVGIGEVGGAHQAIVADALLRPRNGGTSAPAGRGGRCAPRSRRGRRRTGRRGRSTGRRHPASARRRRARRSRRPPRTSSRRSRSARRSASAAGCPRCPAAARGCRSGCA